MLGEAQRAQQAAIRQKSALVNELNQGLVRRENLAAAPTDPTVYKLEEDFITGQKQRIGQADQAILRAKRGLEKALRVYIHARRQLRMMEVLREKAHAEYRQHLLKHEKREMDDLSIMRARLHREELA